MSLLRLLATGRSLIGMQDGTSRYRMRQANLLPKFGSSGNPFASTYTKPSPNVVEQQPVLPVATAPVAEIFVPEVKPAAMKASSKKGDTVKMDTLPLFDQKSPALPRGKMMEPVIEQPVMIEKDQPALPPQPQSRPEPKRLSQFASAAAVATSAAMNMATRLKTVPVGDWMKNLNPVKLLPSRNKNVSQSVRPRGSKTSTVQCELSLERVKVMRNDLSDADLEVVSRKPAAMQSIGKPVVQPLTRIEPTHRNRLDANALGVETTTM